MQYFLLLICTLLFVCCYKPTPKSDREYIGLKSDSLYVGMTLKEINQRFAGKKYYDLNNMWLIDGIIKNLSVDHNGSFVRIFSVDEDSILFFIIYEIRFKKTGGIEPCNNIELTKSIKSKFYFNPKISDSFYPETNTVVTRTKVNHTNSLYCDTDTTIRSIRLEYVYHYQYVNMDNLIELERIWAL